MDKSFMNKVDLQPYLQGLTDKINFFNRYMKRPVSYSTRFPWTTADWIWTELSPVSATISGHHLHLA